MNLLCSAYIYIHVHSLESETLVHRVFVVLHFATSKANFGEATFIY